MILEVFLCFTKILINNRDARKDAKILNKFDCYVLKIQKVEKSSRKLQKPSKHLKLKTTLI